MLVLPSSLSLTGHRSSLAHRGMPVWHKTCYCVVTRVRTPRSLSGEKVEMSGMLAKGTPVISLDTGVTLGKIESVFLDCEARRLVAFTFSRGGGLLSGKRAHIVEIADIHAIGPDAVTLDDARVVHELVLMDGKCQALVELDQVVKREIMTDGGVKLGHILGLDFDPDTYRLERIRVEDKERDGERIIAGDEVMSIGEEVIVVADWVPGTAVDPSAASSLVPPSPTPLDRRNHDDGYLRAG